MDTETIHQRFDDLKREARGENASDPIGYACQRLGIQISVAMDLFVAICEGDPELEGAGEQAQVDAGRYFLTGLMYGLIMSQEEGG